MMPTCPECGQTQKELCIDSTLPVAHDGLCDSCYETAYLNSLSDEQKREGMRLLINVCEAMGEVPDEEDDDAPEESAYDDPQFDCSNRSIPELDPAEDDTRWNYVQRSGTRCEDGSRIR